MYPDVKWTRVRPFAAKPIYAYKGDTEMDLHTIEDVVLTPCETMVVGTGIAIAIPNGISKIRRTMMEEVKLQSPWVVYAKLVGALFAQDPDVTVLFNNDAPKLDVYVRGADKAESISAVLPCEMTFGNVTMLIEVVPDNGGDMTLADHMRRAFGGNPVLSEVVDVPIVPGGPCMTYALFAPTATQVEVDNAGSPYGVVTITYEDIAKQVLSLEGVMVASELI